MIYILIGVSSFLVCKHWLSQHFSLQATFLVSLAFNSRFGGGELSDVFMPVGIQLVVSNGV
jgi:hypothetical protein